MSINLLPCPFCGHEYPEFERMGDRRQSCIVICGWCGARHESSDEGDRCGSSWNQRAEPTPSAPTAVEPDGQRYQLLRSGQHWSVIDGVGDVLRGDDLDAAVDSILAARAAKRKS